jgi:hypothetical protein
MINFGPLAAQDDPDIAKYFHTTGQCAALTKRQAERGEFIFYARPGSGKTALVTKLAATDATSSTVIIRPENTQLATEDDELNAEDHKILIEHELLIAVASELHSRSLLKPPLAGKWTDFFKGKVKKTLGQFFGERFQGISILGCGFTLRPADRRKYLAEIKSSRILTLLRTTLGEILKATKPLVVIDDPEGLVTKGMDEISAENAKRIGAFLSVVSRLHGLGCSTAAFTKEYILQAVLEHYIDSAHFSDGTASIVWEEEDLLHLVDLRVTKRLNSTWEKTLSITQKSMSGQIFPLLINGPRDLLFLLNSAGKRADTLTKEHIIEAVPALRAHRWTDCEKQYGRQWPKISSVCKAVIAAIPLEKRSNSLPKKDFLELLKKEYQKPGTRLLSLRKEVGWVSTAMWSEPTIDERMFLCGCLGCFKDNSKLYPWMGATLAEYRQAPTVFIPPLFQQD